MRISQVEHHSSIGLRFGAIADADDCQCCHPPPGYAFYGVVHQGTCESVHRSLRIIVADSDQMAVLLLHADTAWEGRVQLALGSLQSDGIAFDLNRDPFGESDRFSS